VLTTIGVFGLMSYVVGQRTREIGVRLALGASPRSILAMTITQGMSTAAIGVALGIGGAMGLSRFLSTFLYDIQPTDAPTFGIAVLLLLGTALCACYIPARRAAQVDPLLAVRSE
jgi:putative ABC transport system permease protein